MKEPLLPLPPPRQPWEETRSCLRQSHRKTFGAASEVAEGRPEAVGSLTTQDLTALAAIRVARSAFVRLETGFAAGLRPKTHEAKSTFLGLTSGLPSLHRPHRRELVDLPLQPDQEVRQARAVAGAAVVSFASHGSSCSCSFRFHLPALLHCLPSLWGKWAPQRRPRAVPLL